MVFQRELTWLVHRSTVVLQCGPNANEVHSVVSTDLSGVHS